MRLPGTIRPIGFKARRTPTIALSLLYLTTASWLAPRTVAQRSAYSTERLRAHDSEQWRTIEEHLPDPATATPQALEMQGDILRARRFPDDALDFYRFAMARGGNVPALLNKLGLTQLEMRNVELARAYFKRAVKTSAKSADAWNNLGAVEYLDRGAEAAVTDYKRAIKLDKHQAVFHANLATAYFETRDFNGARREMASALKLDPGIFDKDVSTGGVEAHVLTSEDRARFSFEMAKLYAHNGQEDQMLHSLAMASEAGMDVQREMRKDPVLAQFENDPRVVVLVHNAQMMRTGHAATVAASSSSSAAPAAVTKPMSE
jgi:tetratricopeptide (TPR) repeat protein